MHSTAEKSRSVTGTRIITTDTTCRIEFTFRPEPPFRGTHAKYSSAANGGLTAFTHTRVFGLTLPEAA
jgi:hypothetical protein